MALNRIKWSINTPEGISPATITIEEKNKTASYSAGSTYAITLTTDKTINAICTSIKKIFLGAEGTNDWYQFVYTFIDEPEKWAQEYEVHFYNVNGTAISSIKADLENSVSPWKIEYPADRSGYKIREWDRTSSLIDVLNEFGDMIGCYPVLNHFDRKIIYLDLDKKFQNVAKFDDLIESTSTQTIYSCELNEALPLNTGIRLLGFYNSRFTQAVKYEMLSFPAGSWSVELLDVVNTSMYEGLSGQLFESETSTANIADFVATTKLQLSNYMLDSSAASPFSAECKGYYFYTTWQGISHYLNSFYLGIPASASYEITDWEEFVPYNYTSEGWVYPGSNATEILISMHFRLKILNVNLSSANFYIEAERQARDYLQLHTFDLKYYAIHTGEFFEKYKGAAPHENIVVEILPPKPTSSTEDMAQKLIDKIWFFKSNRKHLRITTDEKIFVNGDLYTNNGKSGLILSNSSEWSLETGKVFSNIEVIV